MSAIQSLVGLGSGTSYPASQPHKSGQKNALIDRYGAFFESGIRACPESVGVGKFCRLRLRLRLRANQPTPTDSDSGSDSDSAALMSGVLAEISNRVTIGGPPHFTERPPWMTLLEKVLES